MTRNLLVVLLGDASLSELRSAVEERGHALPNVYVVAPAHVGPLHWLATDEQAAREEAGVRALEAEWILLGDAAVGGEAGEADPTLAVEEALRRFPADEILLVGGRAVDRSLHASLRRLGVPITWVGHRHPRAETAADCALPCADSPPVEAKQHRSSRSPAPTSHCSSSDYSSLSLWH